MTKVRTRKIYTNEETLELVKFFKEKFEDIDSLKWKLQTNCRYLVQKEVNNLREETRSNNEEDYSDFFRCNRILNQESQTLIKRLEKRIKKGKNKNADDVSTEDFIMVKNLYTILVVHIKKEYYFINENKELFLKINRKGRNWNKNMKVKEESLEDYLKNLFTLCQQIYNTAKSISMWHEWEIVEWKIG